MTHTGRLKNGLRWVVINDPTARTVSVQMLTLAGSRCEKEGQRGLAHLVEHLLFDGTSQHPTAEELTNQLYDYGAELNAYTNNDLAVYHAKMTPEHLERLLSFMGEILYFSTFSAEAIEKEKTVVLQEVASRTGNPVSLLLMNIMPAQAWAGTPASEPVGGYREDIERITRADVLAFVERCYQPQNIVISVAGRIEGDYEQWLSRYLDYTVKSQPYEQIPLAVGVRQDQTQRYELPGDPSEATVAVVFSYDTQRLCKYIPLLANILFDTMSSRLFVKLRSELGLIYSVSSLSSSLRDVSLFGFVFSTRNDDAVIGEAIDASLDELDDLVMNGVKEQELVRAKRFLTETAKMRLEDSMHLAGWAGQQLIFEGCVPSYQAVEIDQVNLVTAEDLRYAASELFTASRLNLALIA